MRRYLTLVLLILLSACAAGGDPFLKVEQPSPTQSVIYVFRTQNVPRSMNLAPGIAINGAEVGSLPLDGYLRVQVPPGATEVRLVKRAYAWPVGAPLRVVQLDARAGVAHFVEFSVDSVRYQRDRYTNTTYLGVALREVNQDSAMRLLPQLRNASWRASSAPPLI